MDSKVGPSPTALTLSLSLCHTHALIHTHTLLSLYTVVDAYTEWCGPCKSVEDTLKSVKLELADDKLHYCTVRL
jgi:thiol-disulfide isomerase/thioredoxin